LPSDYTHLNLADVEDMAPTFGLSGIEARFVREPLELEQSGLSFQRLAPNARLPFGHRHKAQEEVYVVIGGSGRARIGEEIVELAMLDVLRVAAPAVRAIEAGPDGLEVVAFGARTDPDAAESEVVEDFWPD
jgi:mannose-6-phosphate isomerase-like protein (cupin superfamily)